MSHHTLTNDNAGIKRFRLAAVIRGLDLEVRTGMKLTRNMPTLKAIRDQYGVKGGTKVKVLAELRAIEDLIESGDYDPMGLPG